MSSTESELRELSRKAKLLEYANTERNEDDFNDVTIQVGSESISANRMVLSCYSNFFRSMFHSRFKEVYQNKVEIRDFDGKIIKAVIEYIYTGVIKIDVNNVLALLGAADFLQVDDVKQMCFDFMESSLTIESCLDIVKACVLYNNPSPLQQTYRFISTNFDEIVKSDNFKQLSNQELTSLLTNLDRDIVQEISLYTATINWVKHDQNHEKQFPSLFLSLNLKNIPFQFLANVIAKETLITTDMVCLNAVVSCFADAANKSSQEEKLSAILCVGGLDQKSVVEVYNCLNKSSVSYPDLPNNLSLHCALNFNGFVYCLGGSTTGSIGDPNNNVYRSNVKEANSKWEELASMTTPRCAFGAAVWNGHLVAAGGVISPGITNSTELYEVTKNSWREIASMNEERSGHALVVADNQLFAIGGFGDSSAEMIDHIEGNWRKIQPMNESRCGFAAVSCENCIYAIGGDAKKTVEKYDLNKQGWSFVKSMNVERSLHAACVLDGKIFVVGGIDARGKAVKTIECYDPSRDEWSVVGETEQELINHAVVAV